ncbi:MAG: hypothetical protein IJ689_07770 [Alphaproteobacteria bacterium]|nr:hypothetical protein [Alphaproteobacteria bacterium]MBR1649473.1 hypothetical protein [Alphaproteobacteria bacterium]
MKNYILLIGVAGVALGSYCAYAGNSATMTVTATIAHDVSLSVTRAWNIGTITINPSEESGDALINKGDTSYYGLTGGIISITGTQNGRFTANLPESCQLTPTDCLNVPDFITVGGIRSDFGVGHISGSTYEIWGDITYDSLPQEGEYSASLFIEYITN